MGVSHRELCRGCQRPIDDKYLLKVLDDAWHESCLQCCVCFQPLSFSCFIRDNQFFCKRDYEKMFGVRCRGCLEVIGTEDLVMRASQEVIFHVQCFACCVCGQLLQKGDQLSVVDSSVYCQVHSDIFLQRQNKFFNPHQHLGFCDWFAMSDDDSCSLEDGDNDQNKGPKRPRTILTTSQRRKFKASFEVNPKPCRKVRETLASETGLSVRVVQVWFQNQRAKMKKLARRQTEDGQNNGDKEKKNNQNKSVNKKKKEDEVNGVLTPLSDSSSEAVGASPGESKSSEGTTDAKNNQLNTSTPLSNNPEKRHSTSLDILLPQDLINNEKYSNDKHNFFDSYQSKNNEPHNHQQQSQQHYSFLKESETGLFPCPNNTTPILQHSQKNLPFGMMQDSNPIDRLYSMQSIYFNSE